ncbi:hypothetical protein E3Q22_03247 [Wallemia mellicola]|uniref:Small ribosomal subunit protein mS41 n=2 Tax=Wallemia mellicola TaxID=1708541 RepID=A0A4T0QP48_9BASI|nr:hypothetical protein WALSEDRAFT_48206 [Wallemia mellicola CBS 633.66]TIB70252.1 hypothetical protein E3Q24_03070 [Wallemia mellicola]EIM20010.1 hypothetical protein WALSEDRAFT_48206 [Wallemia mellicola CBS 633.66]TIB73096.1 hypothetical protein E3Q23_03120 [Wallemia mellicola]TIB77093.1 hypothetical protein E3Q22_03247 [Wallemia mellicola]TIB82899.1 hypothetical protein E3Q21_03230 [Wallemia mellicola]|eukprot:XP_006959940.1 hypothetical protein WALSEDRAFT_48206 [Wallemia mellicola CBS 633.66]
MLCPRVNRTSILIRNFSTSIKANASRQVVEPRGKFTDTTTLLSSFGRSLQEKCKIEDWNQLFSSSSRDFERIGMTPQDRKYLLWCLEKFRQGQYPESFAHEPSPKKEFRGWGPRVQHGKRVRGLLRSGEEPAPKR